jgi:hypothetical protein
MRRYHGRTKKSSALVSRIGPSGPTNLHPASIESLALLDVLRSAERLGAGVLGKTTRVRQAGESGRQSSQEGDESGGVHLEQQISLIETSDDRKFKCSDGVISVQSAIPHVLYTSYLPIEPSVDLQRPACSTSLELYR